MHLVGLSVCLTYVYHGTRFRECEECKALIAVLRKRSLRWASHRLLDNTKMYFTGTGWEAVQRLILRRFLQFHHEKTEIISKSDQGILVTNHSTIITHHSPYHSARCRNTHTHTHTQILQIIKLDSPSVAEFFRQRTGILKLKTGHLKLKTGHLKLKRGQRNADTKQHTNPAPSGP